MSDLRLSDVPLTALKPSTRTVIAAGLNTLKWLPCDEGFNRDYRGLAEIAQLDNHDYSSKEDPTSSILTDWSRLGANFQDLVDAFEQLDRFDIHDDVIESLEADAEAYSTSGKEKPSRAPVSEFELQKGCITRGDVSAVENGSDLPHYDAFLLFADSDAEFAHKTLSYLEDDCGMRLCVKDRDLLAGIAFEHDAVTQLIDQRCRHLLIILSVEFFESVECKFYTKFAQALSIEKKGRVVLPIRYKVMPPNSIPSFLTGIHALDYTRAMNGRWNFWEKLRDSIRDPNKSAAMKSAALVGMELPSAPRKNKEEGNKDSPSLDGKGFEIAPVESPSPSTNPLLKKKKGSVLSKIFGKLHSRDSAILRSSKSKNSTSDSHVGGESSTMLLDSLPDPPSAGFSESSDHESSAAAAKKTKNKSRLKLGLLA